MCGRYAIFGTTAMTPQERIDDEKMLIGAAYLNKRIERDKPTFNGESLATLDHEFQPNFDASPTQTLPIFRNVGGDYEEIVYAHWGLIPPAVRDPKAFLKQYSTFNARADRLAESKLFRKPFLQQRCLVPMNGFYEWQQREKDKVRHFIRLADPKIFACGGLWTSWEDAEGQRRDSFTIITCRPNELLAKVHNTKPAMPLIVPQERWDEWTSPKLNGDEERLQSFLQPFPAEEMIAYPVKRTAKGPELLAPAGPNAT